MARPVYQHNSRGSDRSVRSLMALQSAASTARALNLISVWRKHGEDPGYRSHPFFLNPVLNRSIVVKHRLRPNEREDMPGNRSTATKVILPIDPSDLRLGARSFFVRQRGYDGVLDEIAVGNKGDLRDAELLSLLDELPSLDPFLMRERLKKRGYAPDRCYFELSEADAARMFSFARIELTPLIGATFDDLDVHLNEKTAILAEKVMSNAGDAELEPLRHGLNMTQPDFEEGVFCWKGFIYYKWTLADLLPKVRPVMTEIERIKATGQVDYEDKAYIETARARLGETIGRACDVVRRTLRIYDEAYADLTRNGQPQAFREFLLKAPTLFHELGERLGAVNHIVSFWRYRFPEGARVKVGADELVELLSDFEMSLAFDSTESAPRW
jgi:hypothetical protein